MDDKIYMLLSFTVSTEDTVYSVSQTVVHCGPLSGLWFYTVHMVLQDNVMIKSFQLRIVVNHV
jgi:hypothetical protein